MPKRDSRRLEARRPCELSAHRRTVHPVMRLRVATRLLDIQRVLVRHGLDEIILATHLFRPLRYAFYLSPATWFERKKGGPRGERIRLALEELGPIFVKFGQALSTRRDLLPRRHRR